MKPDVVVERTVVLIEDDENHAMLISRLLKKHSHISLIYYSSGKDALEALLKEDNNSNRIALIIMDLRMNGIDGLEILKILKNNERYRITPVVVLSTSSSERDIIASYQLTANSYLIKPLSYDDFSDLIKDLTDYWLKWNQTV